MYKNKTLLRRLLPWLIGIAALAAWSATMGTANRSSWKTTR